MLLFLLGPQTFARNLSSFHGSRFTRENDLLLRRVHVQDTHINVLAAERIFRFHRQEVHTHLERLRRGFGQRNFHIVRRVAGERGGEDAVFSQE